MKYTIIVILSLLTQCISDNNTKNQIERERIIGNWYGVQIPETDFDDYYEVYIDSNRIGWCLSSFGVSLSDYYYNIVLDTIRINQCALTLTSLDNMDIKILDVDSGRIVLKFLFENRILDDVLVLHKLNDSIPISYFNLNTNQSADSFSFQVLKRRHLYMENRIPNIEIEDDTK